MEKLGRAGWERIDTAEQDRLIAEAVSNPRSREDAAGPKDGMGNISKG
jgi:hypothetical protein